MFEELSFGASERIFFRKGNACSSPHYRHFLYVIWSKHILTSEAMVCELHHECLTHSLPASGIHKFVIVACFPICRCMGQQDDDTHAHWRNSHTAICIFYFVVCRTTGSAPGRRLFLVLCAYFVFCDPFCLLSFP